jgi:hypothetical protein
LRDRVVGVQIHLKLLPEDKIAAVEVLVVAIASVEPAAPRSRPPDTALITDDLREAARQQQAADAGGRERPGRRCAPVPAHRPPGHR